MSHKPLLRIIVPLIVVAAIAGGLYFVFLIQPETVTNGSLRLFGNVDIRQVRLAFHDTGRILRISVQEGVAVTTGELVAQLDPVRFESAVDEARGKVASQKQVLARLLAGSRPEEIAAARARVDGAEATAMDAEKTYRRMQTLAEAEYVSRQKRDDAEAALQNARANLDAARQALTLAIKGPREEDIAAARARLEEYSAALAFAEQQLADTQLRAPSNGIIQDRILEPGDMAFPGTPVMTLALNDPVWIRAYLAEPDLGRIAPGMAAEVRTDSFPDKTYPGWVGFISPTAEFTPKRVETTELRSKLVYQVRVYVCNPDDELRLGMPVTVDILLQSDRKSVDPEHPDPCRGE